MEELDMEHINLKRVLSGSTVTSKTTYKAKKGGCRKNFASLTENTDYKNVVPAKGEDCKNYCDKDKTPCKAYETSSDQKCTLFYKKVEVDETAKTKTCNV